MILSCDDLVNLALSDFNSCIGKVFVTKNVVKFGRTIDEDKQFFIKDGVRIRVLKPTPSHELLYSGLPHPNLTEGWLDMFWPVEVLDQREGLDRCDRLYVISRSFHESGIIEDMDNLL